MKIRARSKTRGVRMGMPLRVALWHVRRVCRINVVGNDGCWQPVRVRMRLSPCTGGG